MKYKIIVILGTLAAIAGLASPSHAQPTEGITLSSNALNLENRTVEDDYREFFRIRASNPAEISNKIGGATISDEEYWTYLDGDDGVLQINDRVELAVNEPVSPPVFPTLPSEQDDRFDGVEKVGIKYELIP